MKKNIIMTLVTACITTVPLYAEIDDDIFAIENIEVPPTAPGCFRLESEFDSIAKAGINTKGFRGQGLTFGQASVSGSTIFWANVPSREFYSVAAGYSYTHLCWDGNPYFCQDNFNEASLALQFYSNRLYDWIWQGKVGFNIDLDHCDFNHYLTIDMLLWGRYDFCDTLGIHIGILALTGMKMDRIYPIIGIDWMLNPYWKVNAIFPMNVSLEYRHSKQLTPYIGLRFFDIRHRTGPSEPLPKALVSYKNISCEGGLQYHCSSWLEANLHGGTTVGGKLRIADKDNRNPHHFKLNPSVYVGGELVVKF